MKRTFLFLILAYIMLTGNLPKGFSDEECPDPSQDTSSRTSDSLRGLDNVGKPGFQGDATPTAALDGGGDAFQPAENVGFGGLLRGNNTVDRSKESGNKNKSDKSTAQAKEKKLKKMKLERVSFEKPFRPLKDPKASPTKEEMMSESPQHLPQRVGQYVLTPITTGRSTKPPITPEIGPNGKPRLTPDGWINPQTQGPAPPIQPVRHPPFCTQGTHDLHLKQLVLFHRENFG